MKSTPFPTAPWSKLAVDILGPLPSGESILVLVGYYSRFFEIDVIHSTTSRVVIHCLDSHFARRGVPDGLHSGNGPQFMSAEFTGFLQELGIVHHRTTPLWPEASGEVERQNRSLLKAIRAAHAEGRNWRSELNKFLLAYRATPHSTTGVPPASSLFRRTIKTKLPAMSLGDIIPNDRAIRDRVAERQQVSVDAAQCARRCAPSELSPGDAVLLKQPQKENKLSANFHADPFTIVDPLGDQAVIASPEGVTKKGHMSDLKLFHQPVPEMSASTPETSTEDEEPRSTVILPPSGSSTDSTELRRSTRLRQQPEHLKDYVC